MLIHFLTYLTLLVHLAYAKHSTCWWQAFKDSPVYHRYFLWCIARFHELGPGKGQYLCDNSNTSVADWGILRPNVLEWGTPCGSRGFALDDYTGGCPAERWALCLGSSCGSPTANCLFQDRKDDCEWPTMFNDSSSAPKVLEVWALVWGQK